jgi:soluble lytic murein transglycosylase
VRRRALLVCAIAPIVAAANLAGQPEREPRLPAPAEKPSPTEALIQRARFLSTTGNHRESAETWQSVAAAEPVLADFAQREVVRAQIAAGNLQDAFVGLAALGSNAPADLLLSAAAASHSAGLFDRAASFYRQARNSAGRTAMADQAALGLAATLELDRKPLEALGVFRDLQLTFRQASAYDLADAGARRLSAQLDGADPLTEQDYDAIADRLAGVAAFRRAVDVLTEWRNAFPGSFRLAGIEASIVQHLYSLRANDESRARAESFLKVYPENPLAATVFITLFRLDVREGRTTDVDRRGTAILSGEIKDATLADRQSAGRLLAEYLVSVGQPARALAVYDRLYRITSTRGARVDLLWRIAIAGLRAGNRTRAINELRQVLRLKPDSETERAVTYWLAYAEQASGSETAAKTLWAALVQRYPFSYYGIRAAEKLGAPLPPAALTFPEMTLGDAVLAHPDFQAASILARAGSLADAAVYARRLNGTFRRDEAVALLAARASEAAGDYTTASTLMSGYFGPYLERLTTNLPVDFWLLAYPRAYWVDVAAAASRHGVDPLLMLALARQESHFDRTARSPVGAMGLFQIMPYTAVELDPAFAESGATDRLLQADVSAELAASLLERLQMRYQGAVAPAIASYNADKERVQVWWDAARDLPEELFIDSIPYRETRAYVRQVLANYAMYRRFDVVRPLDPARNRPQPVQDRPAQDAPRPPTNELSPSPQK